MMDEHEVSVEVAAVQDEIWKHLSSTDAKGVGMMPPEMSPYWSGHRPRFDLQVRWFITKMADLPSARVLDVGTGFPFATAYWALRKPKSFVVFGCPIEFMPAVVPHTQYEQMNLCRPFGPLLRTAKFELVVCTECLEHLSCNLYAARNRLMALVEDGGFLLLSFPLNGSNARDYHLEWPDRFDMISDAHVREFTEETMDAFTATVGWPIVAREIVWSPAYGGNIGHVLMQNKGVTR